MKIFFIDPNNNTAQVNYPLAESLLEKDVDITYFTSYNRWDASYYDKHYHIKVIYLFFKLANKISNVKLRQIIKALSYPLNLCILFIIIIIKKPLVLHINFVTIPLFDYLFISILKAFNFKIIFTLHNYLNHEKQKVSKFFLKVLNKADYIVCLSDFTKNQFPKILARKIIVIEHGNTYEKEINLYSKYENIRKSEKIQLLFIGLLRPYKGIEILINSLEYLRDEIASKIHLKIVGHTLDPSYYKKIKKLTEKMPNNVTLIHQYIEYSQMIELIQESNIGVLPYITATQSGIPYLYAGLKKPIIITNVGGLSEQVSVEFAEIAEPNDKSLAKSIERMVIRLENRLINDISYIKFNEKNAWLNIVLKYKNLYKTME